MSSEINKQSGNGALLPFSQSVARRIAEELFQSQPLWKTGELRKKIVQVHKERGGFTQSNPDWMITRGFQELKEAGLIGAPSTGSLGFLEWKNRPQEMPTIQAHEEGSSLSSVDEGIEDIQQIIEKELGEGIECVYLYFNPNDRELARLKGKDVWECKIGRTSSCDAIKRVFTQGVRTALSHLPTIGLVLRTDDSIALESALHSSLKVAGADVPDSPGSEWFFTSPARVEAWYENFQKALAALKSLEKTIDEK